MPLNNPAPTIAEVTSGTYTGADSVNRAVPHGLARVPKIVILIESAGTVHFQIFGGYAFINVFLNSLDSQHAVTAPDSTNFHVGNATSYAQSANAAATDYRWVAIG